MPRDRILEEKSNERTQMAKVGHDGRMEEEFRIGYCVRLRGFGLVVGTDRRVYAQKATKGELYP